MRKVINGKTYNTATSKLIGQWSNGYFTTEFSFCSEDLYKNTKGAYFIHYMGGASSKYGQNRGSDHRVGGEGVSPLSYEDAKVWAETHLDYKEYEAEFNQPEEAEGDSDLTTRERVNLTLDTGIMSNLRKLSDQTGVPMARMVDKAILAMYGDQFNK